MTSPSSSSFVHPRKVLEKFSPHKKQIWVVGYVNSTLEDSIKDLEVAFANGADAIVYESQDYKKLDETLAAIRKRFPSHVIGVNVLGKEDGLALYTWKETFALAKKHNLQIAWTDFSGVDLIKEAPEVSLHSIKNEKPDSVFYVSGIHMKYSTLIDQNKPIELSALQAMGWVDGIVITGPKTGVPADPERAHRAREVIGNYPLGAASGVSSENVHTILKSIDFVLVNTSISDKNHRIIGEKVKALRLAMNKKK
ncbi:MAG: BtpA/SgcQ family protein [Pseudobdellovibrionaceae bacterium]